jgi:hypothetical protein
MANKIKPVYIIEDAKKDDFHIKAIKNFKSNKSKKRLFLDVDGTLVAMQYNPN